MNTNINIDTNIITYLVGGLRLSDLDLISGKGYHLVPNNLPGIDQTGRIADTGYSVATGTIKELLAYASNYIYCGSSDHYCFLIIDSTGKVLIQCNCIVIEDESDYDEGD